MLWAGWVLGSPAGIGSKNRQGCRRELEATEFNGLPLFFSCLFVVKEAHVRKKEKKAHSDRKAYPYIE